MFFALSNCILSNVRSLNEIIKLNMMETFCLPILLFATAAIKLSYVQINEINASWNSIYRCIFVFNKWESIRIFIDGLDRLDFNFTHLFLHLQFCKTSLLCQNVTFANIMKIYYCSSEFKCLCAMRG